MPTPFPRLIASPPASDAPSGTVQFYDGYFPALPAGTYNIGLTQTVTPPHSPPAIAPYQLTQTVIVQAPEFTIDTTIVQSTYPADGASDVYGRQLPFVVLTDPSLPWERSLVPDQPPSSPPDTTPWLALLLFAEGEIYLPPGSNNPVTTCTVAELLADDPNVLKPQLPAGWVSDQMLSSQCQTITIPGATFEAVMPALTDLPYLAHCRVVNLPNETSPGPFSVILSNRLPLTTTNSPDTQSPLRYFAHLVSLEGFAAYLAGPDAQTLPQSADSPPGLVDVQLVSLFNWTFVSLPETGLNFEQLLGGLIESESATPGLALPVDADAPDVPPQVRERLEDGYVALEFVTGCGERSFAWYRGPLSPVVPQPLPAAPSSPSSSPSSPPAVATPITTADALMIYLAGQGLFDLSYAAAWNLGRGLALADASFSQALTNYRLAATRGLTTLTQRLSMRHFTDGDDLRKVLRRGATRRRFVSLIVEGLGADWTLVLSEVRRGARPAARRSRRRARARALHPRDVLARPGVVEALGEHLGEVIGPMASWLASLSLLYPVPFSHMVPDPRMLPVESIRFFYVDAGWIDALVAGAVSPALQTSADVALLSSLWSLLSEAVADCRGRMFVRPADASSPDASADGRTTGMLIRSQLVSGWPTLVVSASAQGAPVTIARLDRPSPSVLLCLFEGVPDTLSLAEPYQGLVFGVEENGIVPRYVTPGGGGGPTGAQIPASPASPAQTVPPGGYTDFLSTYCRTFSGGVIEVAVLATALARATDAATFGAGDFAIQLVQAPELQSFVTTV